jgi:KDO2-lipid IV(A) lauroyltransferase
LAKPNNRFAASLEFALASTLLAILRVLPRGAADAIAGLCTRILDVAVPKLRRVANVNLAFAFPELSPHKRTQIVDGVFRSVARLLVAFAKLPDINRANVSRWIRYEGLENYEAAKTKSKGLLIATAHLGNWELSAFTHALMTEPMNVMVRPLDNPLIDEVVEQRRQMSGNKLILKKEAAMTVMRALRNNEPVGILIDQNTTADEGVFIDFFGRKACAGAAFVKLAARTGAAVLPGFAFWEEKEQKYVLRFYPEIAMTGDVQADTQRVHSYFERLIREYPDQWLWIHRRWKTRPPGEPDIY